MRKTITLFFTILVLTTTVSIVYSAYREPIPIVVKGNLYILDLDMNITFINDYGVVAIYLKPTGGYGYGFIIMKDPDLEYPIVYLLIGNQSNWHEIGLLNTSVVKFRLVIDYNSSKTIFIFNNVSKTQVLDFIPRVEYLYLSLFNLRGRAFEYPKVFIKYMRLYVLNKTIDEIDVTSENIDEIIGVKPVIDSRRVHIPPLETQRTPSEEYVFQPIFTDTTGILLALLLAIIAIVIVVVVVLLVIYRMSK